MRPLKYLSLIAFQLTVYLIRLTQSNAESVESQLLEFIGSKKKLKSKISVLPWDKYNYTNFDSHNNSLWGLNYDSQNTLFSNTIQAKILYSRHQLVKYQLQLATGQTMFCDIPHKKLQQSYEMPENEITEIDRSLAKTLLDRISKKCYDNQFNEWFYRLCPLNSAHQILGYKMSRPDGTPYVPNFSLGFRTDEDVIQDNESKKSTISDKLEADIVAANPFLIVEGFVGKLFNYKLNQGTEKQIEVYISLKSALNFMVQKKKVFEPFDKPDRVLLREFLMSNFSLTEDLINTSFKYLDTATSIGIEAASSELKNFGDEKISVRRQVSFQSSKTRFLIDLEFPMDIIQSRDFNVINGGSYNITRHNPVLFYPMILSHKNSIFCKQCEFLVNLRPGDFFLIVSNMP